MLEADMVELLESGCGLIVGMVTSQGAPLAMRGWGLSVLDEGRTARILVGSAQPAILGYPPGGEVGNVIAATGASVLTLRSIQLKGPITAVEAADGHDLARMQRYCEAFFDDVAVVDSIPRRLMERMVPNDVVAYAFEVVEVYDQTPGPNAGAAIGATGP